MSALKMKKGLRTLWERAKMTVWALFLFNLILILLAIIFAGQVGFTTALKGSVILGIIMTVVFMTVFLLYELAVLADRCIKRIRGKRNIH